MLLVHGPVIVDPSPSPSSTIEPPPVGICATSPELSFSFGSVNEAAVYRGDFIAISYNRLAGERKHIQTHSETSRLPY